MVQENQEYVDYSISSTCCEWSYFQIIFQKSKIKIGQIISWFVAPQVISLAPFKDLLKSKSEECFKNLKRKSSWKKRAAPQYITTLFITAKVTNNNKHPLGQLKLPIS